MTIKKITDIANKLSIIDMENLIWIFRDRIVIYAGLVPAKDDSDGFCVTGELDKECPVNMNGVRLQINMEGLVETLKENADLKQLIKESEVK